MNNIISQVDQTIAVIEEPEINDQDNEFDLDELALNEASMSEENNSVETVIPFDVNEKSLIVDDEEEHVKPEQPNCEGKSHNQ